MWKKIWSLILALTMLSSLSATGFAVENKDSTDAGGGCGQKAGPKQIIEEKIKQPGPGSV